MKTAFVLHDCEHCALKKVYWDITVESEDVSVYNKISTMLDNATQANSEDALDSIPEEFKNEKDIKEYKIKAKTNLETANALIAEWWQLMKKKYGVNDSAKFDSICGMFFRCVDKNGVAQLSGAFVPKE